MLLLLASLAHSTATASDLFVCANPLSCSLAVECVANPLDCYPTVQDAVDAAADNDRILLSNETYTEQIVDDGGADGLVLEGDGATIIEGASGNEGVKLKGVSVTLRDLTITTPAGASRSCLRVENSPAATLDNVTITGCSNDQGAGLHAKNSTVTVLGSTFLDNHATNQGGGHVWCEGCTLTVEGTSFAGGTSASNGAGIRVTGGAGPIDISGSSFDDNVASTEGGAISTVVAATIDGCTFTGNTADDGGALSILGDGYLLVRNTFCQNTATGPSPLGGAVHGDNADGTLLNNAFVENGSSGAAGGVALVGGTVAATNNSFVANTATGAGAAVQVVSGTLISTNDLYWLNEGALDAAHDLGGTLQISYAWFGANLTTDSNGTLTSVLVGADPLISGYIAGDCDPTNLVPDAGSPLVEAGDPATPTADGRPPDIGAFGGDDAPVCVVDTDADGTCDTYDLCEGADDALDADGDGAPDACDPCPAGGSEDDLDLDEAPACTDCDDADPEVWPGAPEIVGDGVDQDCDGSDTEDEPITEPGDVPGGDPGDDPTEDGRDFPVADTGATATPGKASGCGCASSAARGSWLLVLALLGLRRRR